MKLHYRGKYNLDPTTLPTCKHQPNAVKFKEVDSTKELAVIANDIAIVLMILLSIPVYLKYKGSLFPPCQPRKGNSKSMQNSYYRQLSMSMILYQR